MAVSPDYKIIDEQGNPTGGMVSPTIGGLVIQPTTGGLYEVIRNGQRVATGTKQYAEQVASGQTTTPVSMLSSDRGNKIISDALTDTNRPITPTETKPKVEPTKTTEDKMLESEFESSKTEAQRLQDELRLRYDKQENDLKLTLAPLAAQLERNKQGQIQTIQSQYAVLRSQLEESNRRRQAAATTLGFRRGGQYAPDMMSAQVEGVVQQGIAKLNELNSQEVNAVAAVNSAYDEKSLTLALEEYNKLTSIRKERDKALDDISKNLAEANKKMVEENQKLANNDAIYNEIAGGITDKTQIYYQLRNKGVKVTPQTIDDFVDKLVVENSDNKLTDDEKMLNRLITDKVLPVGTTIFDFWKIKKETQATPDDPLSRAIKWLDYQQKIKEASGYVSVPLDNERNVNYSDAFRASVSDATVGQQSYRGQYFSDLINRGDFDKAREYIFQTAIETAPTADQQKIGGAADTLKALADFKILIDDMSSAGVPTNLISGGLENAARKLGETTNKKYVEFQSRASKILFDYRKAMTGVQFSFAEGQQYQKLFPNYINDITVNKTLIDSMTTSLSTQVEYFYKRKLGSGNYDYLTVGGSLSPYGVNGNTKTDEKGTLKNELDNMNLNSATDSDWWGNFTNTLQNLRTQ